MAGNDTRVCDRIWSQYRKTKAVSLRNWLIQRYLPVVTQVAEGLRPKLPKQVQLDERVSAGSFGLIFAIARFNPTKGVKFETYCYGRVHGAMRDYLRGLDFKPRTSRQRCARFTEAARLLSSELGRVPNDAEIQQRLNVDDKEFRRYVRAASPTAFVSLSRDRSGTEGSKQLLEIDTVVDRTRPPATLSADREDLRQTLIKGLSRRDRLILTLYYYEGLTMREIGYVIGISESRVSQKKDEILDTLRQRAGLARKQDLLDLAA